MSVKTTTQLLRVLALSIFLTHFQSAHGGVLFIPAAPAAPDLNRPDLPLGQLEFDARGFEGGRFEEPAIKVNLADPANIAVSSHWGLRISGNAGASFGSPKPFPVPSPSQGIKFYDGDTAMAFDRQGRLFWANLFAGGNYGNLANKHVNVFVAQIDPSSGSTLQLSSVPTNGNEEDDKPFLTADDHPLSPFSGTLYVTWARFTKAWEIFVARSVDHGASWSQPLRLSDSATQGFVWTPQVNTAANGDVYVAWHATFDGFAGKDGTTARTLVRRSTDRGLTFSAATEAFTAGQSDLTANIQSEPGAIPGTGFLTLGSWQPFALADPVRPGNVYVVAADDPDDSYLSGDASDVVFARSTNNGATWTRTTLASGPNNSFQLFPTAAIDQFGDIVVAWYDNRRGLINSNGQYLLDVFATYSTDGGKTWAAAFQINDPNNTFDADAASVNVNWSEDSAGTPPTRRIGEYFGIDVFGGTAYVAWNGLDLTEINGLTGAPPTQQVWFNSFPIKGSLTISGDENGVPSDDTIIVRRMTDNPDFVEALVNGRRKYAGLLSALTSITINGGAGHDGVTVEKKLGVKVTVLP